MFDDEDYSEIVAHAEEEEERREEEMVESLPNLEGVRKILVNTCESSHFVKKLVCDSEGCTKIGSIVQKVGQTELYLCASVLMVCIDSRSVLGQDVNKLPLIRSIFKKIGIVKPSVLVLGSISRTSIMSNGSTVIATDSLRQLRTSCPSTDFFFPSLNPADTNNNDDDNNNNNNNNNNNKGESQEKGANTDADTAVAELEIGTMLTGVEASMLTFCEARQVST